jgi:hypothetical protein
MHIVNAWLLYCGHAKQKGNNYKSLLDFRVKTVQGLLLRSNLNTRKRWRLQNVSILLSIFSWRCSNLFNIYILPMIMCTVLKKHTKAE